MNIATTDYEVDGSSARCKVCPSATWIDVKNVSSHDTSAKHELHSRAHAQQQRRRTKGGPSSKAQVPQAESEEQDDILTEGMDVDGMLYIYMLED